ncbi:MAG TPA: 16S rRNA (guanine(966)-N(2))-methyltransferase RsmD [Candidatus Dormibacteraeota bacterium]
MAQTRITAGEWRGRVVSTPSGREVRPTRAMVRQSLYDILGNRVVGARMLDLYAGAGTVGFEALSRGAATVTFVERHREALTLIAKTAERFGCRDRISLVGADVPRWLRGAREQTEAADLCYVDAPYQDPELERVLELLGAAPPRLVVCEHHRAREIPEQIGTLTRFREARYGLTTISFLQRTTAPSDGTA